MDRGYPSVCHCLFLGLTLVLAMCVKSTFAACLQMDDASSWSGKWEVFQRAEPCAEAERQVPLSVCLPSPFLHWVASLLWVETCGEGKERGKRGIQEEEEKGRRNEKISRSRSDIVDSWEEVLCSEQRRCQKRELSSNAAYNTLHVEFVSTLQCRHVQSPEKAVG